MPLSETLQSLHEAELSYKGDPSLVSEKIKDVNFHGLIGVTKSGKTTVLERIVGVLPDSNAVPSRVDRPRKPGDPKLYETVSEGFTTEIIINDIAKRAVVNYAVFPTGNIYTTYPHHYTAEHNFLPTMSSSIEQLRGAGFKKFDLSYIFMRSSDWKEIIVREQASFNGKTKERMEEVIESTTYGIEHAEELNFIYNEIGPEGINKAVLDLADIALGSASTVDKDFAVGNLRAMRSIAEEFITSSDSELH